MKILLKNLLKLFKLFLILKYQIKSNQINEKDKFLRKTKIIKKLFENDKNLNKNY